MLSALLPRRAREEELVSAGMERLSQGLQRLDAESGSVRRLVTRPAIAWLSLLLTGIWRAVAPFRRRQELAADQLATPIVPRHELARALVNIESLGRLSFERGNADLVRPGEDIVADWRAAAAEVFATTEANDLLSEWVPAEWPVPPLALRLRELGVPFEPAGLPAVPALEGLLLSPDQLVQRAAQARPVGQLGLSFALNRLRLDPALVGWLLMIAFIAAHAGWWTSCKFSGRLPSRCR